MCFLTCWFTCRSVEFYDKLQNSIGGGKPKMRWYFGEALQLFASLRSAECEALTQNGTT